MSDVHIAWHEKQPLQWDSHELASWLSSRGLPSDVTEPFKQQSVFGLHAINLHEDDLVKLGIRHPIRRRRVIRELQQLFHGHSFASASVSDVSPADETAALADARSYPIRDATNAQAGRIPGWEQSSVEWSSAGPVFTGQEADAVEVDLEGSLELLKQLSASKAVVEASLRFEDEPTGGAVEAYMTMRQLSASKASLSRKCMKLRQELIEERRKRSIAISDYERRVHEAVRDRNGVKYSLRNAVRRSKSKERENEQLQARMKEILSDEEALIANAKAGPAEACSEEWLPGWGGEEAGGKEALASKTKAEPAEVCSQEWLPGWDGKEAAAEAAEGGSRIVAKTKPEPAGMCSEDLLQGRDGKEARGRRCGRGGSRAGSRYLTKALGESSTLETAAAADAAHERGSGA